MFLMIATAASLATGATPAPDEGNRQAYSYREMAQHLAPPSAMSPRCVGRFMRMKTPNAAVDVLLDLDDSGNVLAARLDGTNHEKELAACVLEWIKDAKFRTDAPRSGVYVANFINARMMPKPQPYEQYQGDNAATVANWSKLALCKLSGLPGPTNWKACTASILLVDSKRAGLFARENRLTPGTHKLTLQCMAHGFANPLTFEPRGFAETHSYELEPSKNYRLEPRWDGGQCVVDVVDSESDSPLARSQ
jgi:hypothetical protein